MKRLSCLSKRRCKYTIILVIRLPCRGSRTMHVVKNSGQGQLAFSGQRQSFQRARSTLSPFGRLDHSRTASLLRRLDASARCGRCQDAIFVSVASGRRTQQAGEDVAAPWPGRPAARVWSATARPGCWRIRAIISFGTFAVMSRVLDQVGAKIRRSTVH